MTLTWYDGGKMPPRPRDLPEGTTLSDNGIYFVGDKGTMVCGGWSGPPTLYPEARRKEFQAPAPTIPRSIGHRPEWIKACKDHKPEDAKAGFAYSGPFTEALLVGNLALRLQKRIEWDAGRHEGAQRPRGRCADPQALSRGVRHRGLTGTARHPPPPRRELPQKRERDAPQ